MHFPKRRVEEDKKSSHELDEHNGTTCCLVLVMNSHCTVGTGCRREEWMNDTFLGLSRVLFCTFSMTKGGWGISICSEKAARDESGVSATVFYWSSSGAPYFFSENKTHILSVWAENGAQLTSDMFTPLFLRRTPNYDATQMKQAFLSCTQQDAGLVTMMTMMNVQTGARNVQRRLVELLWPTCADLYCVSETVPPAVIRSQRVGFGRRSVPAAAERWWWGTSSDAGGCSSDCLTFYQTCQKHVVNRTLRLLLHVLL